MYLFFELFLCAFISLASSSPPKKEIGTTILPEKVHLLAKYAMKLNKNETEAMEEAKNFVENLKADKSIVNSTPRGFTAIKFDQNDRTEVAKVLNEMIECVGLKNKSRRRRFRRADGETTEGKSFTLIMLKKTGELFQLTVHVFAVVIGFLLGGVAGTVLATLCSLVGLLQSCAKVCCGCPTKFTPIEGCLNGLIAGFGTVGFAALWLIEVPFTFNNPISNYADLREKLKDELEEIINF